MPAVTRPKPGETMATNPALADIAGVLELISAALAADPDAQLAGHNADFYRAAARALRDQPNRIAPPPGTRPALRAAIRHLELAIAAGDDETGLKALQEAARRFAARPSLAEATLEALEQLMEQLEQK